MSFFWNLRLSGRLSRRTRLSRGASGSQYALIIGLIGVVALGTVGTLGSDVNGLFGKVSNDLVNAASSGSAGTSGSGGSGSGGGDPCTGTATAPTPGQLCTDGTVYAGMSNGSYLYVDTVDESNSISWSSPAGGNDQHDVQIGTTSLTDGRANTLLIMAAGGNQDAPYPAAAMCVAKTAHGHSDWYLPAKNEMLTIAAARDSGVLAGTFNETQTWTLSNHYSSSEINYDNVWDISFYDPAGWTGGQLKSTPQSLRCGRR